MAKKKVSQVNKETKEALEKRFGAYLEALKALNVEHGFQPTALIQADDKGIYAKLSFEQYVTPKKPEVNESSDTNDKGTEG